jgi:hypothetical protein
MGPARLRPAVAFRARQPRRAFLFVRRTAGTQAYRSRNPGRSDRVQLSRLEPSLLRSQRGPFLSCPGDGGEAGVGGGAGGGEYSGNSANSSGNPEESEGRRLLGTSTMLVGS